MYGKNKNEWNGGRLQKYNLLRGISSFHVIYNEYSLIYLYIIQYECTNKLYNMQMLITYFMNKICYIWNDVLI